MVRKAVSLLCASRSENWWSCPYIGNRSKPFLTWLKLISYLSSATYGTQMAITSYERARV